MTKPFQGKIALDIRDSTPDWGPYLAPQAPAGAPNVLFIAWDDLGYATSDLYGGPVQMPTTRRIAEQGVTMSNFHTTALCSPTRSSLLTGRNATSNGMATIAEFSSGFPGISTRIPFENGFISEVLAENGYNTYCVGKWHLTPGEETGMAASKRSVCATASSRRGASACEKVTMPSSSPTTMSPGCTTCPPTHTGTLTAPGPFL